MFGRVCQELGGRQDCRRATLSCRDGLDEVRYCLAQRRQLGTIGQHDRLGKTQGPGHDATPQQNRDSSRRGGGWFRKISAPSQRNGPSCERGWSRLTWGLCRGAAQHDPTKRPQSADASKFYFREGHFLLASALSTSMTTDVIAAARVLAVPDFAFWSSRSTVHFHVSGSPPCRVVLLFPRYS